LKNGLAHNKNVDIKISACDAFLD